MWQSSRVSALRCILRKWEKRSKTRAEEMAEGAREYVFYAWIVGNRTQRGEIDGGVFAHAKEALTIATPDGIEATEKDTISIDGRDYIIDSVQFVPNRSQMFNLKKPGGLTYITLRG